MTKTELKAKLQERGSYFFDRDTMRHWGDTMASFKTKIGEATYDGVECYVLTRVTYSAYKPMIYRFRKDTLAQVWIDSSNHVNQ